MTSGNSNPRPASTQLSPQQVVDEMAQLIRPHRERRRNEYLQDVYVEMVADRLFQIGNVSFRNCDWSLWARLFRQLSFNSHNCGRSQPSVRLVRMVEAVNTGEVGQSRPAVEALARPAYFLRFRNSSIALRISHETGTSSRCAILSIF